jgi:hypothetical protein
MALLQQTHCYPIVLGKLRLNDDRGLWATREPIISDHATHIKRHNQMVETLRELFAPIAT